IVNPSDPNGPAAALGAATGLAADNAATGGTSISGVIAQMVNSLVVIGVMLGGLLAASKLAGGAGEFAVKQAKAASNAVTGYVGKQGKKGARWAGQKAGLPQLATKMREAR